jgi:hypothetical protein
MRVPTRCIGNSTESIGGQLQQKCSPQPKPLKKVKGYPEHVITRNSFPCFSLFLQQSKVKADIGETQASLFITSIAVSFSLF